MKQKVSLILALTMIASFIATGAAAFLPGDVNGDGSVDNKDVVTLFRYVSGNTVVEVAGNCDINGDGIADNKDVVALFRKLSSYVPENKITPAEGSTVSLLTDLMTEWSTNYKRGQLDDVFDYTERCEPVPVRFSWGGDADYTHLLVSENPDMSNALIFLCNSNELDVEDLLPGTRYYWQTVSTKDGVNSRSAVHSFQTLQTIRTVYIPGASNVRDLGGKITYDGKRIKYGVAFRGADLEHITEDGIRKAVDVLGIKTELDLREKVAGGRSPLGDGINYVSVTGPYYERVKLEEYKDALLTELRTFADPDNYPIYFHCSLGRDRTGTLAFILEALAGVSENDLYLDFEASFFSDMGGYIDNTAPSVVLNNLNVLKSIVSPSNKNMHKYVRSYLKKLSMTDAELDAIRANLTEDVK